MSERDIKRDREKLEDARRYNYNASTWDQTMEQGRRVKELIEEALPCYIALCEHQQRMLDEAIDTLIALGYDAPERPFKSRARLSEKERKVKAAAWSDYLDQKAKEGEGK